MSKKTKNKNKTNKNSFKLVSLPGHGYPVAWCGYACSSLVALIPLQFHSIPVSAPLIHSHWFTVLGVNSSQKWFQFVWVFQSSPYIPPSHTLVIEARQLLGFWTFSVWATAGSGRVRKEKGAPLPVVILMCPGLSARFWRRLLSNMEEVLDAKLSLVLQRWRHLLSTSKYKTYILKQQNSPINNYWPNHNIKQMTN